LIGCDQRSSVLPPSVDTSRLVQIMLSLLSACNSLELIPNNSPWDPMIVVVDGW
jgi:hypothetical protein